MIYKCEKCNEEMKLMRKAKYCPICGSAIRPIDLEKKVADLYNSGKTVKEIAAELKMTEIALNQMISKAALNNKISSEGLIQAEYETAIMDVIMNNWDGKLKTIKKAVPDDCTYTTINYYVRKQKRVDGESKVIEIRNMIKKGIDVRSIADTLKTSVLRVERVLVEEIEKDKAIANAYINTDYKAQIIEIVNSPDWDGKLRSIKNMLPDDVTYTNIKATIAKNKPSASA